jgi:hypothetical protein
MKYFTVMRSGAMIYIPSFVKSGSDIQKLIGMETQANTQRGRQPHKPVFVFFKIRKAG